MSGGVCGAMRGGGCARRGRPRVLVGGQVTGGPGPSLAGVELDNSTVLATPLASLWHTGSSSGWCVLRSPAGRVQMHPEPRGEVPGPSGAGRTLCRCPELGFEPRGLRLVHLEASVLGSTPFWPLRRGHSHLGRVADPAAVCKNVYGVLLCMQAPRPPVPWATCHAEGSRCAV